MVDIQLIRNNPNKIQDAAKAKGVAIDVQHILEIDTKYRELALSVQKLREERNKHTESLKGKKPTPEEIATGKGLKERLEKEEHAMNAVYQELQEWLLKIPNPAKDDVPVGKDESENVVIKTYKEPTKFSFTPKDHLELGETLDIIDIKRAAKVSGSRFAYLKNEGALLEFALVQFAMETLIKERFIPVIPPALIKQNITRGLGYWQAGGNEEYYLVNDFELESSGEKEKANPLYLIGTAEHSIVPMHMDEVLPKEELPTRYIGFSPAFRREAGSYGKDTKGIIRVHQFDKVEMVSFVEEGKDEEELLYLLSLEEKFFQMLEIPYQVIKMCTGDLGFPAAKKFDIEAWMPAQNKYREVTSVSTVTDFQARRLLIKYNDGNDKKYVTILNGTAFAIGRTIVAILENYQQEDGTVVVPEVLRKYVGKDRIGAKK